MEKHKIVVPSGVRYISDWEDYRLEDYNFPHILNKVVTGCGYTEFCIRNGQNIILVSPRKFLLQNKLDQHQGEVYYVKNELETSVDYELDISKDDTKRINEEKQKSDSSDKNTIANLDILKENVRKYVEETWKEGKPCKILVTYDSFRHVKSALEDCIDSFQIVIDEFQSIFMDSHFKADTELEFLTHLNGEEKVGGYKIQNVCYVSATPALDKYLEMLDEFKDLPYYEFDWETEGQDRVKKPKLDVKFTYGTLNKEVKQIIQKYLNGKFESRKELESDRMIESKEAVIFLNSVGGICQAIRSNSLLPDQCNILCADSTDNRKKVRTAFNDVYKKLNPDNPVKLSSKYNPIGSIPMKGEPHKMFTFCTRTVYLGADFYSTCARTFIFSDSNIECLSVDISMDLEQILGRQRLEENPWRNSATLVIKTTVEARKMVQEHFDNLINLKKEESYGLLRSYEKTDDNDKVFVAKAYRAAIDKQHYKSNYVSVNRYVGSDGKVYQKPVFNNLLLVSEIRAFEVQQKDYKNRFIVLSTIRGEGIDDINDDATNLAQDFNEIKNVVNKLKLLVDIMEREDLSESQKDRFLDLIPSKYRDYYQVVGLDQIKSCSYQESKIKKLWRDNMFSDKIKEDLTLKIYNTFITKGKYSKDYIKQTLKTLYESFGYTKTAKASDLDLYFYTKLTKVKDPSGKWVNGFEIVAKR